MLHKERWQQITFRHQIHSLQFRISSQVLVSFHQMYELNSVVLLQAIYKTEYLMPLASEKKQGLTEDQEI